VQKRKLIHAAKRPWTATRTAKTAKIARIARMAKTAKTARMTRTAVKKARTAVKLKQRRSKLWHYSVNKIRRFLLTR
jgi:hypothetical protein